MEDRVMAQIQGKKFKQIVETLKSEFKPSRMFLFGSRANGTPHPDSDYDFVLVVPGNKRSRYNNMRRASDLLSDKYGVSADVFVYSQREFDEWKNELSSIPETALNTGKEIDLG
jgi:predicted nucleotidyltransferase